MNYTIAPVHSAPRASAKSHNKRTSITALHWAERCQPRPAPLITAPLAQKQRPCPTAHVRSQTENLYPVAGATRFIQEIDTTEAAKPGQPRSTRGVEKVKPSLKERILKVALKREPLMVVNGDRYREVGQFNNEELRGRGFRTDLISLGEAGCRPDIKYRVVA